MTSPREMVRSALKEGHNDYASAFEHIKRHHKSEMSPQQFGQLKRLIIAEPNSVVELSEKGVRIIDVNTPEVAMSGLELARVLKTMVKAAGIQRVRETLDIMEELTK